MPKIKCLNCGSVVDYPADSRCTNCNIKWWGYGAEVRIPKPGDNFKPAAAPTFTFLILDPETPDPEIIRLGSGDFSLGRDAECSRTLKEDFISRKHCTLSIRAGGKVKIQDHNSTNGSFADGQAVEGDKILNKDCLLRFGHKNAVLIKAAVSPGEALKRGRSLWEKA